MPSLHQLHRIFATQTRLIYSKAPKIMITRLIVSPFFTVSARLTVIEKKGIQVIT